MATYEQEMSAQAKKSAEKAAIMAKAQNKIQSMIDSGEIAAAEDEAGKVHRAFIAPVEKNTRILVKAGTTRSVRDPNSPTGERLTGRSGDVFVEFTDGICVLDPSDDNDQLKIAWCEAHPEKCRDITDPFTEAWAFFKESQLNLAGQEARLPESINIERILAGDPRGNAVRHSAVERAKERVESLKEG